MRVGVRRLPEGEGLNFPAYMSAGAAGADVPAAVCSEITLAPGARTLVPTGFSLAVPSGYEVQVRPRSGFALRSGVTVLNAPGTIDSDYRGPVGIILVNLGAEPVTIRRGDRIAQLVLAPVSRATFDAEDEHAPTLRAAAGFGSTGA